MIVTLLLISIAAGAAADIARRAKSLVAANAYGIVGIAGYIGAVGNMI